MSVGDVNGTAPGSGARYNDGKDELDLIPVRIISDYLAHHMTWTRENEMLADDPLTHRGRADMVIMLLARWQETLSPKYLYRALCYLDDPIRKAARVFTYGKRKYSAWNWIRGMLWSVPLGCALRHAFAMLDGEIDDPESGLPHEGHLACNLIMLIQFMDTYKTGNDMPSTFYCTGEELA